MNGDQITRAQVAALCLLAAAGSGPHRRLQRLAVWRSISLPVARALLRGAYARGTADDVELSPMGDLVVAVARVLRKMRRATCAAYVLGGDR